MYKLFNYLNSIISCKIFGWSPAVSKANHENEYAKCVPEQIW